MLFLNREFVVDIWEPTGSGHTSLSLEDEIKKHGGTCRTLISSTTNYLVTDNVSSYKCEKARQINVPVVSEKFIRSCVDNGTLQEVDPFLLPKPSTMGPAEILLREVLTDAEMKLTTSYDIGVTTADDEGIIDKLTEIDQESGLPLQARFLQTADLSMPATEWVESNYVVLRAEYFNSTSIQSMERFQIVEIHVNTLEDASEGRKLYRVFHQEGTLETEEKHISKAIFFSRLDPSLEVFYSLCRSIGSDYVMAFERNDRIPSTVGSRLLQLSPAVVPSTIPTEVAELVRAIFGAASSEVRNYITCSPNSISQEQAEKAIGILLRLNDPKDMASQYTHLVAEFHKAIPLMPRKRLSFRSKANFESAHHLVELIMDLKNVSECLDSDNRSTVFQDTLRYRSLNTVLVPLARGSAEYEKVASDLKMAQGASRKVVKPFRIYKASRYDDEVRYSSVPRKNERLLYHGSSLCNFVGILSRGLHLPREFVTQFAGKRSNSAALGKGIYFSTDAGKAAVYATNKEGMRLLGVFRVNLGESLDTSRILGDDARPPKGYSSIHGEAQTESRISDFMEEEYVVFEEARQKLEYLIEFVLADADTEDSSHVYLRDVKEMIEKMEKEEFPSVSGVGNAGIASTIPMTPSKPIQTVKTFVLGEENYGDDGLGLVSSNNAKVKLQSVHVRSLVVDAIARVILLQEYRSDSSAYFEGKYVFPLDSRSAVCGFEAFIGAKHVVGEVKKKEEAHRIYKEAIERGDGAYLMDEEKDKPSIFTVSLGNIPPNVQVVIKIVYITELFQSKLLDLQRTSDDPKVDFGGERIVSLEIPSLSKLGKKQTELTGDEVTQLVTGSGKVVKSDVFFTFQCGIIMSSEILRLDSDSHKLLQKVEKNRATVDIGDEYDDTEDLRLFIHVKREHNQSTSSLWVENIDQVGAIESTKSSDGSALMLSVLPELPSNPIGGMKEVVFLLDSSQSMANNENAIADMKRVVLTSLSMLENGTKYNIVAFGSHYEYLFLQSALIGDTLALSKAEKYIQALSGNRGSTELLTTLLAVSHVRHGPLDILLISDGEFSGVEMTKLITFVNEGGLPQSVRIFGFGVGANQDKTSLHRLTSMGRGRAVFIEHGKNEADKISAQLKLLKLSSTRSVKIRWFSDESCNIDHEITKNGQIEVSPTKILSVFHQDLLRCYAIVNKKLGGGVKIRAAIVEIEDGEGNKVQEKVVVSKETELNGTNLIHTIAARSIIRDWESGLIHVDPIQHHIQRMKRKDRIVELSVKYSLVTQFTSFIAVEKREMGEKIEDVDNLERILSVIKVDMTGGMFLESLPFSAEWTEADGEKLVKEIVESVLPLQLTAYKYEDYGGDAMNEFNIAVKSDDTGKDWVKRRFEDVHLGIFKSAGIRKEEEYDIDQTEDGDLIMNGKLQEDYFEEDDWNLDYDRLRPTSSETLARAGLDIADLDRRKDKGESKPSRRGKKVKAKNKKIPPFGLGKMSKKMESAMPKRDVGMREEMAFEIADEISFNDFGPPASQMPPAPPRAVRAPPKRPASKLKAKKKAKEESKVGSYPANEGGTMPRELLGDSIEMEKSYYNAPADQYMFPAEYVPTCFDSYDPTIEDSYRDSSIMMEAGDFAIGSKSSRQKRYYAGGAGGGGGRDDLIMSPFWPLFDRRFVSEGFFGFVTIALLLQPLLCSFLRNCGVSTLFRRSLCAFYPTYSSYNVTNILFKHLIYKLFIRIFFCCFLGQLAHNLNFLNIFSESRWLIGRII